MKPYRFAQKSKVGFRLVVFAINEKKAREYVKNQAISSLAHRSLKFVGEGHPPDGAGWCAAVAK